MKKLLLLLNVLFLTTFISIGQKTVDNSKISLTNSKKIESKNLPLYDDSGTNPTIIKVIPSPVQSTDILDIAFDGEYLWVNGYQEYFIHQISLTDGSIIKSIPTNINHPTGLTFGDGSLWTSDPENKIIQKIDTTYGNIIKVFPTPAEMNQSFPQGLAWDGTNIWCNDSKGMLSNVEGDSTFMINTNGTILQSYQAKGKYPTGLAYDGYYLWSSDNDKDEIYKIDINTFLAVDTIDAPGGNFPNGLAFDGQYLWVANNDADSIYQIDIGFIPTGLSNLSPESQSLVIYPNPSSGKFIFNGINSKEDLSIFIFNLNGQLILNKKLNKGGSVVIDLNEFESGIFFYTVSNQVGILESGKLIKE